MDPPGPIADSVLKGTACQWNVLNLISSQPCIFSEIEETTSKAMKTLFSLFCLVAVTSLSFGQGGSISQGIASLNALGKTPADQQLVLSAVGQQTRIPEATLQSQMNQTKLSYGDLLVANTIAQTTKQKLDAVIAQKQGKDWSAVASEHKVDTSGITARLKNATKAVQAAQKTAAVKPKASATPTATPKRFRPGHFDSD